MWDNFLPSSSLHSLKGADAGNGIRVFVPDVGMFIASLTIWLVCRNIVKKPDTEEVAQFNSDCENEELVSLTICIFLLQSSGPSLWDCVEFRVPESVCRELWGSMHMRHKSALSLFIARVTLLGRHSHPHLGDEDTGDGRVNAVFHEGLPVELQTAYLSSDDHLAALCSSVVAGGPT